MSIIRLIHIKIDPSETETAERIWKTECATLMRACIGWVFMLAFRGMSLDWAEPFKLKLA
jgi:hypothetical protein